MFKSDDKSISQHCWLVTISFISSSSSVQVRLVLLTFESPQEQSDWVWTEASPLPGAQCEMWSQPTTTNIARRYGLTWDIYHWGSKKWMGKERKSATFPLLNSYRSQARKADIQICCCPYPRRPSFKGGGTHVFCCDSKPFIILDDFITRPHSNMSEELGLLK